MVPSFFGSEVVHYFINHALLHAETEITNAIPFYQLKAEMEITLPNLGNTIFANSMHFQQFYCIMVSANQPYLQNSAENFIHQQYMLINYDQRLTGPITTNQSY